MDLYAFNRKNSQEKTALVWKQGQFLAVRIEPAYRVALYHLGKFFVEVLYDAEQNQIYKMRAFKSRSCLEPYLDLVDLTPIIPKDKLL